MIFIIFVYTIISIVYLNRWYSNPFRTEKWYDMVLCLPALLLFWLVKSICKILGVW